jgi:hypothetical protein
VVQELPLAIDVREIPLKSTYNEPTVMWRLRHDDGRWAHAVIGPRKHAASAIWFINGQIQSVYEFETWTAAINWTEEHRVTLQRGGWRSAD